MKTIYTYSNIQVHWNLNIADEECKYMNITPIEAGLGLSGKRLYAWYEVGNEKRTLEGRLVNGVVEAEIASPLPVGTYSLYAEISNYGETMYEREEVNAFAVTRNQEEADNEDGSDAVIELISGKKPQHSQIVDGADYEENEIERLPHLYLYGDVNIVWNMEREFNVRPELKEYDVTFRWEASCYKGECAADISDNKVSATIEHDLKTGIYNCFLTFSKRGKTVIEMQALTAFVGSGMQDAVMNPDGATVTVYIHSGRVRRAIVTPLVEPMDIALLGDLFDVDLKTDVPERGDVLIYNGNDWQPGRVTWSSIREKPEWMTRSVPDLGDFGNQAGYIKGITEAMITNALGYKPLGSVLWADVRNKPEWMTRSVPDLGDFGNQAGYLKLSDLNRTVIINALGYNPEQGVSSFAGLSEVTGAGAPQANQVWGWNGTQYTWLNQTGGSGGGTTGDLTGYLTKAEAAQTYLTKEAFDEMFYKQNVDGNDWIIVARKNLLSLYDLIAYQDYLNTSGGSGGGSTGVSSFAELSEVKGVTWQNGQTLVYQNGSWMAGYAGSGATKFSELSDVKNAGTPSINQVWGWNGTGYAWLNQSAGTGGGSYNGSKYVKVDNTTNTISLTGIGTAINHDDDFWVTKQDIGKYALKDYVDENFLKSGSLYWANVTVESSGNTNTKPQFGNVGIGAAADSNYRLLVNGGASKFNYYIETKSIFPIENDKSSIGDDDRQYSAIYANALRGSSNTLYITQMNPTKNIELWSREAGKEGNTRRMSITPEGYVGFWSGYGTGTEWLRIDEAQRKIYLGTDVGTSRGVISWDAANNAFIFEGNICTTGDVITFGTASQGGYNVIENLNVGDTLTIRNTKLSTQYNEDNDEYDFVINPEGTVWVYGALNMIGSLNASVNMEIGRDLNVNGYLKIGTNATHLTNIKVKDGYLYFTVLNGSKYRTSLESWSGTY